MAEARNGSRLRRVLWFVGGALCFGVGLVGVALPGIPTTGPMILALACFARSSRRVHDWLYNHPRFGPPLREWRAHRVIPARAKVCAVSMMALSATLLVAAGSLPNAALVAVLGTMLFGAAFILSCPSAVVTARRSDP